MNLRRTKIVATIGPASRDPETLRKLIDAGLNVARLNFSHGNQTTHGKVIDDIRNLSSSVAIIQDLQGPRIRVGSLRAGAPVQLESGAPLILTTRSVEGDSRTVGVTYKDLPRDVKPGMTILIDDGLLQLLAKSVNGDEIECEVVVGGTLRPNKGINVPAASISAPALTEKDIDDMRFGVKKSVDYIALSFVKSADDIRSARKILKENGAEAHIIAKIERREAVANLEQILVEADGVMVARGDLGVETSSADVPVLQKRIIALSNRYGRLDITATQMLESMTVNPRPTRAEACDVANAVFDGTDAIMLSAETAAGKYPVESVTMMDGIAREAEAHFGEFGRRLIASPVGEMTVTDATARATCLAAEELGARAIVVLTRSGRSAIKVSERRPPMPIIALTPCSRAMRRLSLAWGVRALLTEEVESIDDLFDRLEGLLKSEGLVGSGDTVVVAAGHTVLPGATNMIRIMKMGS